MAIDLYRRGEGRIEVRAQIARVLLKSPCHNIPGIISESGVDRSTVYSVVRRMVRDEWLREVRVPRTQRRDYVVTTSGRRGMAFIIALADQSGAEDSLDSNPTAARSSS